MTFRDDISFLLTNRLPRRWATIFMGWLSGIEQPLVRSACISLWRLFSDLDLSEAKTTRFRSLQECFTRELRAGARPLDGDNSVLISPVDGIVGASGRVVQGTVLQTKGFPYTLRDLLGDDALVDQYRDGSYITLRLTPTMYHRFHAPHDCRVEQVTYFSGDTWNVNPITLRRVERLFCKNERAAIQCRLASSGHLVTLVPVAAILVASIRLHFLNVLLHLRYRGPNEIDCEAAFDKGEEMGWFEHGSTIVVLAPRGFRPIASEGERIRAGQPLMRLPGS